MLPFRKGRYCARFAATGDDLARAQRLRYRCFIANRSGAEPRADGREGDRFDGECRHVLIEEAASGRLVCCYRLLPFADGKAIGQSYSAQHYDLAGLQGFRGRLVEMGRFCIHPDCRDPDILRIAWAAMTRHVDESGVEFLFGCTSFEGTDAGRYSDVFALLRERHIAPSRWRPRVKAARVIPFSARPRGLEPDRQRGLQEMPPLLRHYLGLGGWVSDHAVVDADLGTLHVFTGLEIRAIPPARARLLRATAGT